MRSIHIISPDPETAKTLSLRFELAGLDVKSSIDVKGALADVGNDQPLFLLDMIDDADWQWSEAKTLLKHTGGVIVLLPRGLREFPTTGSEKSPKLAIRRPYELESLVQDVKKALSN